MREEAGLFDGEVEVIISDPADKERIVTRIMAKLIDADKRIAEIKKLYCDGCDNRCGAKCLDCWVDDAMCLIDDAPTVDAVEVVHGHWKEYSHSALVRWKDGEPVLADRSVFRCSRCDFGTIAKHNYCPRCGAKMDGDMENYRQAEVIR